MVSYTGASRGVGDPKAKAWLSAIQGLLGGGGVSGTLKLKVLSYIGVAYLLFVGLSFVARDLGALKA
jgi:hypothetical protein